MDWQMIPPPETSGPVVVHGDFWHENILVDEGSRTLGGVIDWEAVRIGHPAQDLVTLRYLGHGIADRIAAGYAAHTGRDLDALTRDMTWFWEARDVGGIEAAVEMRDAAELDDAIRKLRAGPILHR
jgi:aminoglycoside phosphotransferase (APT) family kinase protein